MNLPARDRSSLGTGETRLYEAIRVLLLRELKREAGSFEKLGGGRNSRVFRVNCEAGPAFVAKAYFRSAHDLRDRLGCEFRAFQFLREQGVRELPEPLAIDESEGLALYEFIDGTPLRPDGIGDSEVDRAVELLRSLKAIARSGSAAQCPDASEACFSVRAILESIDFRLRRLEQPAASAPDLASFLRERMVPFRARAEQWARAVCRERGIPFDSSIPTDDRTLSPSDFGFHNALRRGDGRLVFLDFEYFGWDDPAKTISDFLLHPAMELPLRLAQRFFENALAALGGPARLADRVRAVYPLFGLKWCAILLNEFAVDDLARRRFSDASCGAWDPSVQLEKARRMLARVECEHDDFPYHT